MKPRHIAMGVALVLAAGLVVFGDSTPESTIAEPVERVTPAPASRAAPVAAVGTGETPSIARLLPRENLIGDAGDRFGQGGPGLFGRQDWTPPPPPQAEAPPPPPPPPPVAPPLPFTYVGKSLQDGAYEVYLARGDRIVFVRDGMTIDGIYRVEPIRPPTLTLTYLPLDQVQQINIGAFD